MKSKWMRALLPALVLAVALGGCGSGDAAENGGAASVSVPAAESSASVGVSSEDEEAAESVVEDAPVSSQLIPENLTEQYATLLAGLWVEADSGDSYYINADGSGSLYRADEEEPDDFTWSVLEEQDGDALLYLFFTGAEAAECYLPVFDEDSLTLCDPDSGDAVLLLTVGETFG